MAWTECNVTNIEQPTLLWTNPNPTSSFAAQTVNVDVRNYEAIGFLIQNRVDQTDTYQIYTIRQKPIGGADALGVSTATSAVIYPSVRGYTINSSTGAINFSNSINTYDSETRNEILVPLKIYGYKVLPITSQALTLKDVNPNLSAAEPFRLALKYYNSTATCSSTCVKGYSKVKVKAAASSGYSITFYSNTGSTVGSTTSLTSTSWIEITIPSGAYVMQAKYTGTSSNNTVRSVYYALLV
jgi:hypothetical protein